MVSAVSSIPAIFQHVRCGMHFQLTLISGRWTCVVCLSGSLGVLCLRENRARYNVIFQLCHRFLVVIRWIHGADSS